ncbi:MFS transporter [Dactylosporangium sp. NPDC050688]|uniref:MFS transporter n=1 Tax=Dactylosporangium sp. NPDC050688 TaxID=3157217 RepID=UPI0033FEED8A
MCFLRLGRITVHGSASGNTPSDAGVIMLVAMIVFIASYAFSLGPVVWTVINEIYPSTIRGLGVSAATAANWAAAWLVTQFFLSLTGWIGESGTFGVFAAMCAVSFVFVWKLLPETKGKTLGEIQQMWVDRAAPRVGAEP